jgi:hypothetical protein
VSIIATWVFSLASSVSRVCVSVRVPWFVCNRAVKCAVAGALIATSV